MPLFVREKKISLFCNNFTLIEFYILDNSNSSRLKNESSVCQYGDLWWHECWGADGEAVVRRRVCLVGDARTVSRFLLVYILLKCEGTNSVIFRQERIGYKGRPFSILKFRTMRMDSERDGQPRLAEKEDDRLTRVGKFLREHHWMNCRNCGMSWSAKCLL